MSLARFGDAIPNEQAIRDGASKAYGAYYDIIH
jgi:hypothetical protein